MPLQYCGSADLPVSRGIIRLGRSLALPELRKAVEPPNPKYPYCTSNAVDSLRKPMTTTILACVC